MAVGPMPETHPSAADAGGNPLAFETSILQFVEAGLAVVPRAVDAVLELAAAALQLAHDLIATVNLLRRPLDRRR